MPVFEGKYPPPLQGVSQQLNSERLPGQVEEQVNMISDPVTLPRRRPGAHYKTHWTWEGADTDNTIGWFGDISGERVHVLMNTASGKIKLLDEEYTEVADLDGGEYLKASKVSHIRAASVGTELFLLNTAVKPELRYESAVSDPSNSGFFHVVSGAFSKNYNVTVVSPWGNITASYTTPSGAGGTDAANATPEAIATALANQLSGQSLTTVRINSITISIPGGNHTYGAELQKNYGTEVSPDWRKVTLPADIPASDFTSNLIRIYHWQFRQDGETQPVLSGWNYMNCQVYQGNVWSAAFNTTTVSYGWDYVGTVPVSYGSYKKWLPVPITRITDTAPSAPVSPLFVQRDGPYVFVSRGSGISVNTNVGSNYLVASSGQRVPNTGMLPARLPIAGDGLVCRVGTGNNPQYFQYKNSTTSWEEVAKWGSPTSLVNCPISIIKAPPLEDPQGELVWQVKTTNFEGRFAGDDDSNETHAFMTEGITGISTYQGRLVLMAGPMVSLSASNRPRRFFRSTVTGVINSDPIEIGSSLNSAAAYEWAVPFQKDLLLFSKAYQAVIPFTNTAITPSNAVVLPTSTFETDTTSSPVSAGRTLLYCTPNSSEYLGVMEMIPSSFTDSQYVSLDATPHLTRYIDGRCRFSASSTVSNTVVFGVTTNKKELVVYEYHWSGDEKIQQAWHKWVFPYEISTAYFASDMVVLVFVRNGVLVVTALDPRRGLYKSNGERDSFYDMNFDASIVENKISIPEWAVQFDPDMLDSFEVMSRIGDAPGAKVDIVQKAPTVLTTHPSWTSGEVTVGIPHVSYFTPSSPVVRDYKEQSINTGKATVLRYTIQTNNTTKYSCTVHDKFTDIGNVEVSPVFWYSPELIPGSTIAASEQTNVVPARTELRSSRIRMSATGSSEMNITGIEYTGHYNQRIKRI